MLLLSHKCGPPLPTHQAVPGTLAHPSANSPSVRVVLLQVERLSGDNADEVRKQLYLRNVSSHHELAPEGLEPMPQPRRLEGDVVEFNRCVGVGACWVLLRKQGGVWPLQVDGMQCGPGVKSS